jgi:hypothetical protein
MRYLVSKIELNDVYKTLIASHLEISFNELTEENILD